MSKSRLARSSNATLRDVESVKEYCDTNKIPYSQKFLDKVLPDEQLRQKFVANYDLTPFLPTTLTHHGASTIIVFEDKENRPANSHAEVVSAVAQEVGRSLSQNKVDTLCVHTSLNPHYRAAFSKELVDSVQILVENQGVPVLHTSIGWNDRLLDFDAGHEDQANHLWRVTAFVVDSAGNDGANNPYQKHNAITHFAPLVVHVGAAAMNENREWSIEGYSSANSPAFLAPVASRAKVNWATGADPAPLTGTSAAAPYASGALAALNERYGPYLTREQILYAVLATSTPITKVKAYPNKTPQEKQIVYTQNKAGLSYNPEYGGFGLMDMHKADKLLMQVVALTQANHESITVPTEERVTLEVGKSASKPDAQGKYHYSVKMPPGFALKTTVEADFEKAFGDISITSPSGTTFPMVMSKLDSQTTPRHYFGMSTCHGWAGEPLEGNWTITSTEPIKRLRLNQHHFLEKDIIQSLDVPALLQKPLPVFQNPVALADHTHRLYHSIFLPESGEHKSLTVGANKEPPVLGDVKSIVSQLKSLPSGFSARHRDAFLPPLPIDSRTPAGQHELAALRLVNQITTASTGRDELRQDAIKEQLAAADEYQKAGNTLAQITPLCNAGYNCLACNNTNDRDGVSNAEKAIPIYQRALELSESANLYHKAYDISCNLYTALCKASKEGKAAEYKPMLEETRKKSLEFSRKQQGGISLTAHRVEEGEYGLSRRQEIGTDNVSQCVTIVAQDPITRKTGVAHIDNENDLRSLDGFFSQFGKNTLNIRLVGARFDADYRTDENIFNVMEYLSHVNANVISADVYGGNDGPSSLVVNPASFTLSEKVPGIPNENEAISNAVTLLTRKGKPLIKQFDYTSSPNRAPIHLNARMISEFRENYFKREEWQVEDYMKRQDMHDRPLLVTHVCELEKAYDKELNRLTAALDSGIAQHQISAVDAEKARSALLQQSLYVGENAEESNKPVYDWIKNDLFREGSLQRTALKGPAAELNVYDPPGSTPPGGHLGQQLTRNASQQGRRTQR